MINETDDIKVSVCVVTYNQEKYIAECLDSLVSQETDFKFEIIVGEDCSTDGTRAIVQQYVDKYPDIVKPIFHKNNVGAVENVKQVYIAAKGKYIAHMDGDDMALPTKLQEQFNILEEYSDCNVCSHDVHLIEKKGGLRRKAWVYPEGKYDIFDLYQKLPFFAHSSKMFVNKYDSIFWSKLLSNSDVLDIDVHVANLEDGDIYHISKLLGAYRIGSGVSNENLKVNKALPLGAERVFEKGLVIFKEDQKKLKIIKELYALAMLQCAYNYAVYDEDAELFKIYVDKSVKQKDIGMKQHIFKLAAYYPSMFFKLFALRRKIRSL